MRFMRFMVGFRSAIGECVRELKSVKLSTNLKLGVCASFVAFTCLSIFLTAQQQPVFRSRVDLVELDVSVLDKDRRPIRGLSRADFTVLEDGKPQEIAVFEPIDIPDPEPPPVAWMREVARDVETNEVRPARLWVIVLDDALIPGDDPWITQSAKKIVRDLIERFGPEDLVSVVYTADSRQSQDFTTDRAKLLATLEKFHPGLARWRDGTNQDSQFWLGSINTVLSVLEALAEIPNTRKNIVWVTPGVPANLMVVGGAPGPGFLSGTEYVIPGDHQRAKDLTTDLFLEAKRANVAVYPIDPCGLMGLKMYVTKGNVAVQDDPRVSWVLAMDHIMATASNTGGRAVVNTNDFTPGIDKIFEENASYYSIGYYSTNSKIDGTLRRLEVKVNHPDANVRTRSSYVAPGPKDAPPKSTNDRLSRAIAAPVAVRDLPLRATVAPFAIPGGRNAAVAIALGVRQPVPDTAAKERVVVSTELRTSAFTTEGDHKGSQRHTARVTLRAGAQGDADYEALSRIDLPPGRYRLRLAAHHEASGKTGTVMADVIVPDFNREPVSISGVVVGVTPGRPAAPRDLFTGVLPILPSAQREFAKTDRASALLYAYQSTTSLVSADVAIGVTDRHGAVLITERRTIPREAFASADAQPSSPARPQSGARAPRPDPFANRALRAAEVPYELPIPRLPPGEYLLTFDVTMGTSVMRRDVRFGVK
jgi:VWFA-related protein